MNAALASSSWRNIVAALCVGGAVCGCVSQRYTWFEPTAANARFKPGHSCAGPHDMAIFPPELGGVQASVVVADYGSRGTRLELWFAFQNDFPSQGLIQTDQWRKAYAAMREHRFDINAASPTVRVTLADGETLTFDIPYLQDSHHIGLVGGKFEGVPTSQVQWPLPVEANAGFDVLLPDIFVDGQRIPTSPIHFQRMTKSLTVGINC
jgi:hypothetical protein